MGIQVWFKVPNISGHIWLKNKFLQQTTHKSRMYKKTNWLYEQKLCTSTDINKFEKIGFWNYSFCSIFIKPWILSQIIRYFTRNQNNDLFGTFMKYYCYILNQMKIFLIGMFHVLLLKSILLHQSTLALKKIIIGLRSKN